VISIGLARGPFVAASYGLLIGPAEWIGAVLNDFDEWSAKHVISLLATSLFYAAAGFVFGWQSRLLRVAESDIADRRARDDVARVLHDTVLQTLALVDRRTAATDPDLARTAREADRELRGFLFGSTGRADGSLEHQIRLAVERAARLHDTGAEVPVSVSVVGGGENAPASVCEAIAAATGEAVANALEHAAASHVVVFVETDDDGHVFASIRDDGCGFNPGDDRSGHGLDESIVGRLRDLGGRAEIVSAAGDGTEVRLWSP
jgi:signal transduction histidine kinase